MALTREEMETIIRRSAADKEWVIWTDHPATQRKLTKLGWKGTEYGQGGLEFRIPTRGISFRSRVSVLNPKPRGGGKRGREKG